MLKQIICNFKKLFRIVVLEPLNQRVQVGPLVCKNKTTKNVTTKNLLAICVVRPLCFYKIYFFISISFSQEGLPDEALGRYGGMGNNNQNIV